MWTREDAEARSAPRRGARLASCARLFTTLLWLFVSLPAGAQEGAQEKAATGGDVTELSSQPVAEDSSAPAREDARADPEAAGALPPPARTMVIRARAPKRSTSEVRLDATRLLRANKKTAEDLLRLVPGLHVVQHGAEGKGRQLFLRGFDAAHGSDVEATLDGIPLNEASHVHGQGYLDLAFLIPEVIEGIDVYKGAYRLHQGAFATAGSIDFRLGVPAGERGLRARYELGDTNRHRGLVLFAPPEGAGGTFVALEAVHDDGFGALRRARRAAGMARGVLRLESGDELFGLLALHAGAFELPGVVRLDDVDAGRVDLYGSYSDATGGSSARALVGGGFRGRLFGARAEAIAFLRAKHLSLDENFTGWLAHEEHGDRRLQEQSDAGAGLRARLSGRLLPQLSGELRLSWEGDVVGQRERGLTSSGAPFEVRRDVRFFQQRGSAAGGLVWRTGGLYLEGGLRLDALGFSARDVEEDKTGEGLRLALGPRLLASVTLLPGLKLVGAYGRGFRPPEARAFVGETEGASDASAVGADVTLADVTLADTAELGARWALSGGLVATATLFGVYVDREVIFDHLAGMNLAVNASRRLGAEAGLSVRPSPWLSLGGDVTAVDARFVASEEPVPGVPPVLASVWANAGLPTGPWASAHALLLGPRPLRFGARAEPAAVLDVSAGYRLKDLALDVAIDNAFDARFAEGAYPLASWWDRSMPKSQLPAVHVAPRAPRTIRVGLTTWF